MAIFSQRYHTDRAKLALELTMRDTLEGLQDWANCAGCWADVTQMEILSIEPAQADTRDNPSIRVSAAILSFPEQHRRSA